MSVIGVSNHYGTQGTTRRSELKKGKTVKKKLFVASLAACLVLPACESMHHEENEEHAEKVRLNDLPADVQRTVQEHAGGAKITKITHERESGQELYEVTIKKDGAKQEFKVGPDGKYLGMESQEEERKEKEHEKK